MYNHDDNYPTRSRFEPSISGFRAQTGPNKLSGSAAGNRANTKHLYNISTTSAQRLRRWSNLVQMLYKCSVFTGKVSRVSTIDQTTKIDQSISCTVLGDMLLRFHHVLLQTMSTIFLQRSGLSQWISDVRVDSVSLPGICLTEEGLQGKGKEQ